MTGSRSLFAAASVRARRLMVRSVALIALSVAFMVARVVEYFTVAPLPVGDVTTVVGVGSSLALIRTGVVMRRVRLAEAAEAEAEQARRVGFLRLRAPDPAAGQCPVCALDDLDALAERDRELELEGTPLARVVAYGPDRAHQECKEAVPYVPPMRSTSGGTRPHAHFGFYAAGKWAYCGCDETRERAPLPRGGGTLTHDGYEILGPLPECGCKQCEKDQRRAQRFEGLTAELLADAQEAVRSLLKPGPAGEGGYIAAAVTVEQMGPLPEVLARPAEALPVANHTLRDSALKPPYLTRAGTYRATCAYCSWTRQLGTEGAGYLAVREHARTCLPRAGVKAGTKPPDGWRQVGKLLVAAEPTGNRRAGRDPLIQVAADIMSRARDFEPGGMLLLTDPGGRVVEGGQILESSYPDGGALLVHARIAGPLRKAHPHLAGVWVRVRT